MAWIWWSESLVGWDMQQDFKVDSCALPGVSGNAIWQPLGKAGIRLLHISLLTTSFSCIRLLVSPKIMYVEMLVESAELGQLFLRLKGC